MSRNIKRELKRIASETGYEYKFLKNIYNEYVQDDGEADLQHIEDISMEHDW